MKNYSWKMRLFLSYIFIGVIPILVLGAFFYYGSKISRNYWLFEPKCRNNAEITYTQRLQIASYFP